VHGFVECVWSHRSFAVEPADTKRHYTNTGEIEKAVEQPQHRVGEHRAVVDARTHHDLSVYFNTSIEEQPQPPQTGGAPPVAQQRRPDLGIGGVNAHVERAEPFVDDPLEIGLGETRERGEVAVEERQAVVVVLEVQTLPHAFGQLVDETERAMVVAGLHPVEHGRVHLDTERGAFRFGQRHHLLDTAPTDLDLQLGLVGEEAVLDDVARNLPVEGEQLVARQQARVSSRRSGRDSHDARRGHATSVRVPRYPGVVAIERVLLAEPRGFCAGVEMAIKSLAWMVRVFEPPVYCYHEIVHNQLVVDRFRALGVVFVDDVDEVPEGAPLMLSAHGSAPEVVAKSREHGRFVVNAVCPLVTKVHHEARVRAGKGYTILYVGHAGHDEAVGALAVAPDAMHLVEHETDLPAAVDAMPDPSKVALLAQTTLAMNDWRGILERAEDQFPGLWTAGRSDLCFATTNRQAALTAIAARADAVLVIGSANSSNTLALVKTAREAGCERVQRINGVEELDVAALGDARVVGVTAGASAPEEVVEAVIARLAPRDGVEPVPVTDEDEYFPPPPELRELMPALDATLAFCFGGDPERARRRGGPFASDRDVDASMMLASLR